MTKRVRTASMDIQAREEEKTSKPLKLKSGNFTPADLKYENALDRKYFRQEVVDLARSLLGKVFIRETDQGIIRAVIVETEAYKAPLDKACHAYNSIVTET